MKYRYITPLLIILMLVSSCKKFLEERSDKSLVVPSSLNDLQALLDNTNIFGLNYPYTIEIGSDDFYVTVQDWNARIPSERNAYIWSPETFNDNIGNWNLPYIIVYYSNIVLDELKKMEAAAAPATYNNIKGQALVFRSFAFLNLLYSFAKTYTTDSAHLHLGISLRLDSDFNKPSKRATLKESYDQLIADTKEAIPLLATQQLHKTRPSKIAAYALLARTYLSMNEYKQAQLYADSALQLNNTLIDYNSLNAAAVNPVPLFNTECIFHTTYLTTNTVTLLSKVDSNLYRSHAVNDLRATVFYKANTGNTYSFKGSYDGTLRLFNGLATDEMYLIRAECLARANNITAAMNDLNTLSIKRWKTGTFIPFTAGTANEALLRILSERRKELTMRGLRWSDIKRLNKEQQFAITIKRLLGNQEYTLHPNSPRYAYPIPLQVIQMTGMPQND